MVSTKYAPSHAPFVGKGRWTMQIQATKDDSLMEWVIDRGLKLQKDLRNPNNALQPDNDRAPQVLWADFKKDVVKITKKHSSESRGKLTSQMRNLEREIECLARSPDFDTDNNVRANEAFLAKELENLKWIEARDRKDDLRVIVTNHGEVLGGIWSGMNRDRKPRDLLYWLKVPDLPNNAPVFKRDSRRMANLTRDYHDTLQRIEANSHNEDLEWDRRTESVLNEVKDSQRLTEQDINNTEWLITYPQVWKALCLAKNGTATGLDGCPYELWKELDRHYEESKYNGGEKEGFDIVGTLTTVFNNIQIFRMDKESHFAEGWMCPIYKKKDPTEISNYRPITLLNTDYKLLTKTLALQLVEPIHKMIHPDQAGFIPKRLILTT